jgi:putative tryptophan/tyrosine transport system substrate-binding protein
MALIGMLMHLKEDDRHLAGLVEAFLQGLGSTNPQLALRASGKKGDYPRLADQLVALRPAALVATSWPTLKALRDARRAMEGDNPKTPIVVVGMFHHAGPDHNRRHFGKHVTAIISYKTDDIPSQWLPKLTAIAPQVKQACVILELDGIHTSSAPHYAAIVASGKRLKVKVSQVDLADSKLSQKVAKFAAESKGQGGLIVPASGSTHSNRHSLIKLAEDNKLPAIYPSRYYPFHRGLISFGADLVNQYKLAGTYVDRILKHTRPAPRAVHYNKTFEMVINLATAKRLGLDPPKTLLDKAALVIQ